jgi:hypothetical protein
MSEVDQPRSRRTLSAVAIGIAIFFTLGERFIFAAALERPIDLSEPDVLVMNTLLVAIPFLLLAKRSSARALPWLLAIAVTGWVRWWYLSMGIDYQRAPDGSGVPMFEAMTMLISPLPISAAALVSDNILRRQTNVR